jgi:hypothetical protein
MIDEKFTLYGMQISWYTAKLRPYLLYKGIDFDIPRLRRAGLQAAPEWQLV